jgi:flagellar biosynthetic protein FlhB
MSEDQSPSEKEHEPTQKKLDDARQKGEIPRSADLITAASYAGFLLAAAAIGGASLIKAGEAGSVLLGQSDRLSTMMLQGAGGSAAGVILTFSMALSGFFLLPFTAAALMVVLQRSMLFTPSKLAPKLERISPISGAKNKFGRKGLFEFSKSAVKLIVISGLLFGFLSYEAESILRMLYLSPALSTAMLMEKVVRFLALVCVISLVIGGVDYFWQKAEHLRSNRMSRKEMMDEQKSAEGDPYMKAKRRQRAQEVATSSMLSDVGKADVVIVNPTHFAVALRWDKLSGRAPICVAKGVDDIAARIRAKAAEAGVPLHSDPPTARLLYANLAIGQEIHPDQFRAVAASIRFAEAMRQKMRTAPWAKR